MREGDDVASPAAGSAHSNGAAAPPNASGGAPSPPAAAAGTANSAAAVAPASKADPQQSGGAKQPAARWSPRDLTTGQSLALGGSVAAALLLTVFRREIAPVSLHSMPTCWRSHLLHAWACVLAIQVHIAAARAPESPSLLGRWKPPYAFIFIIMPTPPCLRRRLSSGSSPRPTRSPTRASLLGRPAWSRWLPWRLCC